MSNIAVAPLVGAWIEIMKYTEKIILVQNDVGDKVFFISNDTRLFPTLCSCNFQNIRNFLLLFMKGADYSCFCGLQRKKSP